MPLNTVWASPTSRSSATIHRYVCTTRARSHATYTRVPQVLQTCRTGCNAGKTRRLVHAPILADDIRPSKAIPSLCHEVASPIPCFYGMEWNGMARIATIRRDRGTRAEGDTQSTTTLTGGAHA